MTFFILLVLEQTGFQTCSLCLSDFRLMEVKLMTSKNKVPFWDGTGNYTQYISLFQLHYKLEIHDQNLVTAIINS